MTPSTSVRIGRVYGDATEALVADVTTADGSPAVVKLIVPRPGNAAANEITVLRLTDGDGACLAPANVSGVIVGRALYDRRFTVAEAAAALQR